MRKDLFMLIVLIAVLISACAPQTPQDAFYSLPLYRQLTEASQGRTIPGEMRNFDRDGANYVADNMNIHDVTAFTMIMLTSDKLASSMGPYIVADTYDNGWGVSNIYSFQVWDPATSSEPTYSFEKLTQRTYWAIVGDKNTNPVWAAYYEARNACVSAVNDGHYADCRQLENHKVWLAYEPVTPTVSADNFWGEGWDISQNHDLSQKLKLPGDDRTEFQASMRAEVLNADVFQTINKNLPLVIVTVDYQVVVNDITQYSITVWTNYSTREVQGQIVADVFDNTLPASESSISDNGHRMNMIIFGYSDPEIKIKVANALAKALDEKAKQQGIPGTCNLSE